MPLLDHFHAPLYPQRSWESFHSRWADSIGDYLNRVLPKRYFTEIQVHLGNRVEADVAEFEKFHESPEGSNGIQVALPIEGSQETDDENGGQGAVAVKTKVWTPPAVSYSMPAVFPDDIEVQVLDSRDNARLVAVVELISPRNKDRPESRRAFAAKCSAYLQRGIGLVIADIVTMYHSNLHNELVQIMGLNESYLLPEKATLYGMSYRPVRREEQNLIDVWAAELYLGSALPLLPLGLRGSGMVPLDLEASYHDACRRSRLLE